MGWGTSVNCEIYFNRMTINNDREALELIKEHKENISRDFTKLKMYAASNIKDIIPKEWKDEPITWLDNELSEIFEDIQESSRLITDLNHYIEDKIKNEI